LRVGLSAAEQLRINIGSAHPLVDELDDEVRGVDAISGLPRKATITSEEVREALAPPLVQIVDTIRGTLDGCSTDLASDLVDNGLVLAGGGSLVRGLDRFLQEQTGLPARYCGDPLTAVARGAYLCLEHFDRWRSALQSSDEDV
jgi:rod shape-determining protein MreB